MHMHQRIHAKQGNILVLMVNANTGTLMDTYIHVCNTANLQ